MEIYKYESIDSVNNGIDKLTAMGWEVIDVDIKVLPIYEKLGGYEKSSEAREIFYVFVEKENSESTLEKSLSHQNSFRENL